MSGGINFIRSNPGTDAFHQGMQQADQRRQSMLTAEAQGMRNLMQEAEAPFQMRNTVANTAVNESNARVTQATEGDRVRLSSLNTTNAELQGFYRSLELLNQGDVEGARFVASQYGQQIPEGVIQNRQLARQLDNIAKQAQAQYPNSPRKQQEYIAAAIAGLNDATQGAARRSDPGYHLQVPNAPQADEFVPSRGGGAGGRPLLFDRIMQAAVDLGYSPDEAFRLATRQRQASELDIHNLAVRMVNAEFQGAFGVRPEQRQQRLQEIIQQLTEQLAPTPQPQPQSSTTPAAPSISSTDFSHRFHNQPTGDGFAPSGSLPRGLEQGLRERAAGMRDPQPETQNYPPAPQDPSARIVGQIYRSPSGNVGRWTGQGWEIISQ